MAELALPLLALYTVLALAAAAPSLGALRGLRRSPLQDVEGAASWVTLGLCLVLAVATASVIATTVIPQEAAFAVLTAASGVSLTAAVVRRLQTRRRQLLALAGLALPVVVLVLYQLQVPGEASTPWQLLVQELQGLNPAQLRTLLLICVCWLNGGWIGWFSIRERSGLVASGLPLVVLISDLVNSAPGVRGLPLGQVLAAAVSGVLLIGWTHLERHLPLWRQMGAGSSGPQIGRNLRLVAAVAVAMGLIALLVPPLNRQDISARFFGGGSNGPTPLLYTEQQSGYSNFVVPAGAIADVGTEVLSYDTSAPGGTTYLQGELFTDFNDGNWYPLFNTTVLLDPGQRVPYANGEKRLRDRKTVSLTVHYQDRDVSQAPDLLFPGDPVRLPTAGTLGYQVGGLSGTKGGVLEADQITPAGQAGALISRGDTLTTYGSISVATPSELERAGTDYPAWVKPYASLDPVGTNGQVGEIHADAVRLAAGATNPYLIARNIEEALRHDETYTLSPPVTPSGVWPILYFLNSSHQGYCQYFASAMGAMLRSLGIPTQLVGGFDQGLHGTIARSDAHVWVQAYFPHYGWIDFEPTPPAGFRRTTPATNPGTSTLTSNGQGTLPGTKGGPHPGIRQLTGSGHHPIAKRATPNPVPVVLTALGVLVLLLLSLLLTLLWWCFRVRTPQQLHRRLSLLSELAFRHRAGSRTLHELARDLASLEPNLEAPLLQLAERGGRIAFGRPRPGAEPELLGWGIVARRYPLLLWRAARHGRRRATPGSEPGSAEAQLR